MNSFRNNRLRDHEMPLSTACTRWCSARRSPATAPSRRFKTTALRLSSHDWHDGQHELTPWFNFLFAIIRRAFEEAESRGAEGGGEAWLMATDDLLVAFSPDGGGPPDLVSLPLAEIRRVEVREDLGTAALKVRAGERGATMAVFSKSLVPALSEQPGQLEGRARSEDSAGEVLQGRLAGARAGRKRCERCGQVIPRRYGVCPACLEKGLTRSHPRPSRERHPCHVPTE